MHVGLLDVDARVMPRLVELATQSSMTEFLDLVVLGEFHIAAQEFEHRGVILELLCYDVCELLKCGEPQVSRYTRIQ